MAQYRLFLANYSLRPYETDLALREVRALFPEAKISREKEIIAVRTQKPDAAEKLQSLSFFSRFEDNAGRSTLTTQSMIEATSGRKGRNIRYGMHSLHEYKGRFYPQLGRALINLSAPSKDRIILDPFCGCGTVLMESTFLGASAVGFDINPIGWMIANAKIIGMKMPPREIEKIRIFLDRLSDKGMVTKKENNLDIDYLSRWFPENNLRQALSIDGAIRSAFQQKMRIFLQVILSNILTNFSYQNPKEQRIRRRLDAPPENLIEAFCSNVRRHLDDIEVMSKVKPRSKLGKASAHLGDCRNMHSIQDNSVDCVVTSPPYATALPYIDANRLSLHFFGFIARQKISYLESQMIGSRDITTKQRRCLEMAIVENGDKLPNSIIDFLGEIHNLNTKSPAGFRRRNMAALLYRYFVSMRDSLREIHRVLKPGHMAHFVVGDNLTVAGGSPVKIPTAQFINVIAESVGFGVSNVTPMTLPSAYNIYSKNAIKEEFISTMMKEA